MLEPYDGKLSSTVLRGPGAITAPGYPISLYQHLEGHKTYMIFISHSSSDKDFVDKLVCDLAAWKFDLWFSTWEIRAGESITRKVQQGLRESDCLIVVLSQKSCKASWVETEVNSYLFREISSKEAKLSLLLLRIVSRHFL